MIKSGPWDNGHHQLHAGNIHGSAAHIRWQRVQQQAPQTRKEKFFGRIDKLIPWGRLETLIEPHYPKAGNGLRPYPLTTMLQIHCMQQWYSLSDPAMEDALYEIASMRLFGGQGHPGSFHDSQVPPPA